MPRPAISPFRTWQRDRSNTRNKIFELKNLNEKSSRGFRKIADGYRSRNGTISLQLVLVYPALFHSVILKGLQTSSFSRRGFPASVNCCGLPFAPSPAPCCPPSPSRAAPPPEKCHCFPQRTLFFARVQLPPAAARSATSALLRTPCRGIVYGGSSDLHA